MTQDEKKLLLKDLCARSTYRVMCRVSFDEENIFIEPLESVRPLMAFNQVSTSYSVVSIDCVKPYLRPLSSMTEEEENEWWEFNNKNTIVESHSYSIDWLNANHFDYRGLIPKGLALEAPEGMYN